MAGGGIVADGTNKDYPGKFTSYVLFSCLIASCGGLIFGYDIGISGGVTSMDPFLIKFFPNVYHQEKEDKSTNQYCKFNSQLLTTFTSSLYLAALVSSFFASTVTRKLGRKWSMFGGGLTFLAGSAVNGFAMNVAMLIIGRMLLGIGIGFANQSVPVYLSEIAPARIRGRLNISFQMMTTIGILVANLINYGTAKIKEGYGWRISLGLASVPALMITLGALTLPDTPNSLIERGHAEEAKAKLIKIRGTEDIKVEYEDMVIASEEAKMVKHPWRNIMMRKNRPQLTMSLMIPLFQQITGINIIMFYAPVLFKTIGFGDDASLMSAVITGLINVFATTISIIIVDRLGRRVLFLEGGIQMIGSMIVVGLLIMNKFGSSGVADNLEKWYGIVIVGFISTFVTAFAWSWGPLGWLVPSEIFPLEIRSAGQCITVAVNMLFTFFIAQAFLPLLCFLKYGLFFMFAAFVAVMTVFIYLFLPETKGVPIEEMSSVWKKHWYWKRFIEEDEKTAAV